MLKDKGGRAVALTPRTSGSAIEFVKNDILVGNIRPYLKKIWQADCSGGTNGDVLVFRIKDKEELMPKYLYHQLASDSFFAYCVQTSRGAKMPRGEKSKILKFILPIPPLPEQARIVAILDKFETLVNDLSEGLPAEIAAVREQYEYYRNKLLTFPPVA